MDDVREALAKARPEMENETAHFTCPKCGAEIDMPMNAFIDWGAPNIHSACGWRGSDLRMTRASKNKAE